MYRCHNANKTSPYRTPTMVQNFHGPGLNFSRGSGKSTLGRMNTFLAPISSLNTKSSISYSCQWCQHLLITENWDYLNNLENHNQNSEKTNHLSKPVSAILHQCSFTSGQVTAPPCKLTSHPKSHNINIFRN
jgi:hypothetical protein